MTEDENEKALEDAFKAGKREGLAMATHFLMEKAKDCFEYGRDVEAERLRSYCRLLILEAGKIN